MKFLDEYFLLSTKTGKKLFHDYAKHMPIIDYHCHLSPQEIAENKRFSSITEVWLGADHYKWRAMRSRGIQERYITGDASDREKFHAWVQTLPWCIANPLYHWTHLELQRYFEIADVLNERNEESIWLRCNEIINGIDFSAQSLIEKSNVDVICTTDDPCDNLEWHKHIKENTNLITKVYPAFRPDKVLTIEQESFVSYIQQLSDSTRIKIQSFDTLREALQKRIQFFHDNDCRLSDHALSYVPIFDNTIKMNATNIFKRRMNGETVSKKEQEKYQYEILLFLSKEYDVRNWTMQLHIGALRNVNPKMFKQIGADTGFDVIADYTNAEGLAKLLGAMEERGHLPKTILYNLNPSDNFIMATMIGAFQAHHEYGFGKMQFGAGWWYNDQKDGILQHLKDLGNLGVLGKFIGMLTDSRSFLSYPRHEYFRRIFCDFVGALVDNGEYPEDESMLKSLVEAVCYNNTKEFFQFV